MKIESEDTPDSSRKAASVAPVTSAPPSASPITVPPPPTLVPGYTYTPALVPPTHLHCLPSPLPPPGAVRSPPLHPVQMPPIPVKMPPPPRGMRQVVIPPPPPPPPPVPMPPSLAPDSPMHAKQLARKEIR